ncbi:GreA/GreB family elongation factor [Zhongshania marina]|uniref:Transcription elongation factor GreA/GreB C-terminal domain-containing protein n=1 Tax=Zhongshania marina TaxID=2304603 RepID=A0A2S4HE68_9GAMM|nr:GreA/GreB family elongation factor [Marortus luteolus]POP52284.1 hypothetical protein C0068_12980 [Marortus luteolus]
MPINNADDIVVKKSDYKRISQLIITSSLDIRDCLENEMARATVYDDDVYPEDAVCLNSIVDFVDVTTEVKGRVMIVLPVDANVKEMKVSVLSPLGVALIGLRKNATINWIMPGSRVAEIKVVDVSHPNVHVGA